MVLDQNMSVLEGSIGMLPRRILVAEEHEAVRAAIAAKTRVSAHELRPMGAEPKPRDERRRRARRPAAALRQPRRGHRVGHDAILLAAATGARAGEHAVDLGAGVGAAGLALARACRRARRDAGRDRSGAGRARRRERRAQRPRRAGARRLTLDVTAPPELSPPRGMAPARRRPCADESAVQRFEPASPEAQRRLAHAAAPDTLPRWVCDAAHLLKPDGVLTLIWRADGLAAVAEALAPAFGNIAILPIRPRPDAASDLRDRARAQRRHRVAYAASGARAQRFAWAADCGRRGGAARGSYAGF